VLKEMVQEAHRGRIVGHGVRDSTAIETWEKPVNRKKDLLPEVVTGAKVQDSQLALPLEKLTERRVQHLYSIMDSAYDAPEIRAYPILGGRQVLVERNPRRREEGSGLDPAQRERFKIRSAGERAYAHWKDSLIPSKLFVRGHRKVEFRLLCGVVCWAAVKILQYFLLPALQP
jgi:hypothetical protein